MSRGPGKLQSAILALLRGEGRDVYGGSGPLTTAELCDELQAAGLVPDDRRAAAFRVYRATRSLFWRGLLEADMTGDHDHGARLCWTWSLRPQAETTA